MHDDAKKLMKQTLARKGPREKGLVAVKQPLTTGSRAGSVRTFYVNPNKGLNTPNLSPEHLKTIEDDVELYTLTPELDQVDHPEELIVGEFNRLSQLQNLSHINWALLATLTDTHGDFFNHMANYTRQQSEFEELFQHPTQKVIQDHHRFTSDVCNDISGINQHFKQLEKYIGDLSTFILNNLHDINKENGIKKVHEFLPIIPIGSSSDSKFVSNWYDLQYRGVSILADLINEDRLTRLPKVYYVAQNTLPDNQPMLYEVHNQTMYITDNDSEITIKCLLSLYGQHLFCTEKSVHKIIQDFFDWRTERSTLMILNSFPGYEHVSEELLVKDCGWIRPCMGLIGYAGEPTQLLPTTLQHFTDVGHLSNLLFADLNLVLLVYGIIRGH